MMARGWPPVGEQLALFTIESLRRREPGDHLCRRFGHVFTDDCTVPNEQCLECRARLGDQLDWK